MELNFVKEGTKWVSTFEATSDFNLHIERDKGGFLFVSQRTTQSGEYDSTKDADFSGSDLIIDYDFSALVYPKYIKVSCATEPTSGIVTSDGEITEIKAQTKEIEITSNGTTEVTPDAGFAYLDAVTVKTNVPSQGGEGGEFKARYFDTTEVPSDMILGVVSYSVAIKAQKQILFTTTVGVTEELEPEAVMWLEGVPLALSADERVMMDSNLIESLKGFIAEQGGTLTEITKEEFYNFN